MSTEMSGEEVISWLNNFGERTRVMLDAGISPNEIYQAIADAIYERNRDRVVRVEHEWGQTPIGMATRGYASLHETTVLVASGTNR